MKTARIDLLSGPWSLGRLLRAVLFCVATLGVAAFAWAAANRIAYPYQLDWAEGGMLQTTLRIFQGEPIYVRPSVEFIPFLYPPLYFGLAASLFPVFGESFLALRVVSLVSTTVCMAVVAWATWTHTRSRFWAFCAAGLFCACYDMGGTWFDRGRVDMLFLAALLAGIVTLDSPRGTRGQVVAALLFYAAFLVKQSALTAAIPLMVWMVVFDRGRSRWLFPGLLLGLIAGTWAWFHVGTDGWFTYYVATVPRGFNMVWSTLFNFWNDDILTTAPALLFSMVFVVYVTWKQKGAKRGSWLLAVLVSLIGISWASRMHVAGYINVVLPAYTLGVILLVQAAWLLEQPARLPHAFMSRPWFRTLVLALVLMQAYKMAYDPRSKVPTERDHVAADAFTDWLGTVEGEIWIPTQAWLTARTGKEWTAHQSAINDIMRADSEGMAKGLWSDLETAVREGRWSMIIVDSDAFDEIIGPNYEVRWTLPLGNAEPANWNSELWPEEIRLPGARSRDGRSRAVRMFVPVRP